VTSYVIETDLKVKCSSYVLKQNKCSHGGALERYTDQSWLTAVTDNRLMASILINAY